MTGLSGAGKSSALKYLEDLGYFWMDNLPLSLTVDTLERLTQEPSCPQRVGLGIHFRDAECLDDFQRIHPRLKEMADYFQMVFLECDFDILVTRYRETRRRHPKAADCTVREAIIREAEEFRGLRALSDLFVDTSRLNVHELKSQMDGLFGELPEAGLHLFLRSFGFKSGANTDADMVLDARFLPNPHYDSSLRPLTGLDQPVREFLERESEVGDFLDRLEGLFGYLIPLFRREKKFYLTVDIGCTGGRHRSVYLVDQLAKRLGGDGVLVQVRHRDMRRGSSEIDG